MNSRQKNKAFVAPDVGINEGQAMLQVMQDIRDALLILGRAVNTQPHITLTLPVQCAGACCDAGPEEDRNE